MWAFSGARGRADLLAGSTPVASPGSPTPGVAVAVEGAPAQVCPSALPPCRYHLAFEESGALIGTRTGEMALLVIEHVVGDYETFAGIFTEDRERRRRCGCRGARVCRVVDDPNDVRVVLGFDTAEHAREHAEGLESHEAIKWATGNASMPRFVVVEQAMETDA